MRPAAQVPPAFESQTAARRDVHPKLGFWLTASGGAAAKGRLRPGLDHEAHSLGQQDSFHLAAKAQ